MGIETIEYSRMVLKLLNNYNKRKAKTKEKKGEFELCSVEVALHQHARFVM